MKLRLNIGLYLFGKPRRREEGHDDYSAQARSRDLLSKFGYRDINEVARYTQELQWFRQNGDEIGRRDVKRGDLRHIGYICIRAGGKKNFLNRNC
jgi:hypothetical protein